MHYAVGTIALFLIVLGSILVTSPEVDKSSSINKSKEEEALQICADPTASEIKTFTAPKDTAEKKRPDDVTGTGKQIEIPCESEGHPDRIRQFIGNDTTYKLFKKNVPLAKKTFDDTSCHTNKIDKLDIEIPEIDGSTNWVYYPEIAGEIKLKQTALSRTRGRESDLMYFIDYNLIFVVPLKNGRPVEVSGTDNEGNPNTFWLVDIYKDTSNNETLPEEAFKCATKTAGEQLAVNIPEQSTSIDPHQLQLQYFTFGQSKQQIMDGWEDECKPAIYLYPKEKSLVNVKVSPQGYLTYVDPPYDKSTGWTVWANPDGRLNAISYQPSAISKTYPYLYYESKIKDQVIEKPNKGWVVKYEELEGLYKEILPKLGLNPTQSQDFIEYWNKALKPAPYYFVGVVDQANVNEIEKLEITPKPDYINRVRIYFERLENYKEVEEPSAISYLSRSEQASSAYQLSAEDRQQKTDRFSVIEWGGMVKNDPNHPFTCSQ